MALAEWTWERVGKGKRDRLIESAAVYYYILLLYSIYTYFLHFVHLWLLFIGHLFVFSLFKIALCDCMAPHLAV